MKNMCEYVYNMKNMCDTKHNAETYFELTTDIPQFEKWSDFTSIHDRLW